MTPRRFQVTVTWEQPGTDRENIIDEAYGIVHRELWEDIEDGAVKNLRADAVIMPREAEAGGSNDADRSESLMFETPDYMSGAPETKVHDGVFHDAPPHPWDQGLWIFPDDHPLARLERHAREQYNASSPADGILIKAAVLELEPPA